MPLPNGINILTLIETEWTIMRKVDISYAFNVTFDFNYLLFMIYFVETQLEISKKVGSFI